MAEAPTAATEKLSRAGLAGWLLLAGIVMLARRPDALIRPQFWAEDGMFYVDALVRGAGATTLPYAGYLHFAPRLAALAATAVDPLWAPAVTGSIAFLATLLVFARLLADRVQLPRKPWLVMAVVLLPDPGEVLFNITNLQWIFALGLVALLVSRDAGRLGARLFDLALVLIAGLSGTFTLLFAPLFVVRAWRRRTPEAAALAAAAVMTAATQFMIFASAPGQPMAADSQWALVPAILGMRLGALLFAGLVGPVGVPVLSGLGVMIALGGGFLIWRHSRPERLMLAGCLGLTVVAALFRCRGLLPDLLVTVNAQRYFFVPQALLLWLLLTIAPGIRFGAIGARILLAAFLAGSLRSFRLPGFVDYHWPAFAAEIRAGRACVFPVNPPGMTISCPAIARPPPAAR